MKLSLTITAAIPTGGSEQLYNILAPWMDRITHRG